MFGVWNASFTDGLLPIAAPIGARCLHCREEVADGDNGAVLCGVARHRECSLRAVVGGIGHLVDHARYCRSDLGPDAGLSCRASSLLVWALFVDGADVSEADLQRARAA